MKFAKLTNGNLVFYEAEQYTFSNMQVLLDENKSFREVTGYKEVVHNQAPEYDAATQYLTESYTEDGSKIYVNYDVVDMTEPDDE